MTIEVETDDSTELIYEALESDGDIPREALESIISEAVSNQIQQVYNNRKEIKQQLDQAGQ